MVGEQAMSSRSRKVRRIWTPCISVSRSAVLQKGERFFQRFPSLTHLRRGEVAAMLQRRDERIERHRSLQTKYRELQEQFTILRHRYFLIECAWCTRRIGWKPKRGSVPGDTSHGICPHCAADMVREIAKLPSTPPYTIN